jgi:hypothetical protein
MALLEQPRVNSKVIEPTVSKVGDLFTMWSPFIQINGQDKKKKEKKERKENPVWLN